MDISPTRADLAMFVYNVAAVTSGGYLAIRLGIQSPAEMVVVALVIGLLWTAYYRYRMKALLTGIESGALFEDDAGPGEATSRPSDDNPSTSPKTMEQSSGDEEDDNRGIDPPWDES
jgi:hypothetical protein